MNYLTQKLDIYFSFSKILLAFWRRHGLRGIKDRLILKAFGWAPPCKGYRYHEPRYPVDYEAKQACLFVRPLFSIVIPVYNTKPALLKAALASVHAQWYPHWQLILVDDASPSEATRQALAEINHAQIQVLTLTKNHGISAATNMAIKVATGDFIVFMDHDDLLTVDCLYELALCIDRNQADFVYSDEDKVTEKGRYRQPHFKPDWSPDTMMSTMYTGHVSAVRHSLLNKVGLLRSEFDGCQDWDLVLRITEQTDRISHIPKVLYHWRMIEGSTAARFTAKPHVFDLSRKMCEETLQRRSLSAVLESLPERKGYFRINYSLQNDPLISIIIPTRDNQAILQRCIDSIIKKTGYCHYEIIIMDNGSIRPDAVSYLETLKQQVNITVVRHDEAFNFSQLCNIGAKRSKGELLLFLNDDTEVLQKDWLERLGGYAQLAHMGAVGAKLLYPSNNRVQHAGVLNLAVGPGHAFLLQKADNPGYFMRNLLEYNWLAVAGACLMVAHEKFIAIEGFSEDLPIAYNDLDLCMRLYDAGYYNTVCQSVRLIHHESASRGNDRLSRAKNERLKRDLVMLNERNPRYIKYDPFFNPNLHPNSLHFKLSDTCVR